MFLVSYGYWFGKFLNLTTTPHCLALNIPSILHIVFHLLGAAQSCPMPLNNFQWLTREEIDALNVSALVENQDTGYVFEVSLSYPKELHFQHNNFGLCPENVQITEKDLSSYARQCHRELYGKDTYKATKLISTFSDKKEYVVHYLTLKTYLELGMKIIKVHRVLSFHQTPYLKEYIDLCTSLRKKSKSSTHEAIWKLMNNALFGKTIQRKRDYLNVSFSTSEKTIGGMITNPLFTGYKIISPNLVACFSKSKCVLLDSPIQIGFSILELSKKIMFECYYNQICPALKGCHITTLFHDTDSFCIQVKSSIKNDDHLEKMKSFMDFSNYKLDSVKYDPTHKNKLFFLKDEMRGEKVDAFIGLRSKNYCLRSAQDKLMVKCKGITKGYKRNLKFKHFKKCLDSIHSESITQYQIRSKNHKVATLKCNKKAVTAFDDKKFLHPQCEGKVHASSYFSVWIKWAKKYNKCPYC